MQQYIPPCGSAQVSRPYQQRTRSLRIISGRMNSRQRKWLSGVCGERRVLMYACFEVATIFILLAGIWYGRTFKLEDHDLSACIAKENQGSENLGFVLTVPRSLYLHTCRRCASSFDTVNSLHLSFLQQMLGKDDGRPTVCLEPRHHM